jgi:hypothetical protein
VVAKVARHDGIGGVLKPQGERDELGTGVEQGFRMHARIVPPAIPALTTMNNSDLPPLIETPPGRYRHYKGMPV